MLRHLAGLAEIVEDVEAALAFYCNTLGLEVRDRMGDDYAMIEVAGVLHFGVWSRAAAAEAVFGSRDAAGRVPLGFTIEFEVDDVDATAKQLTESGSSLLHGPRVEPWGQKSCRMLAISGGLLGFAETPWGRTLKQQVVAEKGDA